GGAMARRPDGPAARRPDGPAARRRDGPAARWPGGAMARRRDGAMAADMRRWRGGPVAPAAMMEVAAETVVSTAIHARDKRDNRDNPQKRLDLFG
ncbi:MAG TPA: hypothetical protein VF062_09050, partial [Candidatus Limnocylindrales bacterium]